MSEQANFDYEPSIDEDSIAMMRMADDGYTPPSPAEASPRQLGQRNVRWLQEQEPDPLQLERFEGEGGRFN
jgi:hypothetical protein